MIPPSREMELQGTKQEPNDTTCNKFGNDTKTTTTLCSSRQWSAFRNPRIVRVSRSFGGKDRHSKVCTVRGLRDRRIRLSVPTAIQLYDLQERLGLSQPSKVIDWLINSTKEDIDKLPPLQLPQGSFGHFLQQSIMGSSSSNDQTLNSNSHLLFDTNSGKDGLGMNNEDPERSKYWDYLDAASKAKSKEGRWMAMNNNQYLQGLRDNNQVSAHNFFPDSPLLSYNQAWDPTLTLAQLGTPHNLLSAASSSSTFGALPHLLFCPPPSTSTFFPVTASYPPYSTLAHDPTQTNTHFHLFTPPSSIHPNPNKLLHE